MKHALIAAMLAAGCTRISQDPAPSRPAAAGTAAPTRGSEALPQPPPDCPGGMIHVVGSYCTDLEQRCLRWLDPDSKLRCAEFSEESWCRGKEVEKDFCIDQFEWPNRPGEAPAVMATWRQAKAQCESEGKRLCGDSEWTLACEGPKRLPYPYGRKRDAAACNIDKPHPDVDEAALADPRTAPDEVRRLWQGEVSGSRDACVSDYGVRDMTGNVDEWVVNESGRPYVSGLKGGYWGPVRTRCRPMTVAHGPDFRFYQLGIRCCSNRLKR